MLFLTYQDLIRIEATPVIRAISSHSNVRLRYLNATHFATETPLESFLKSGKLENSLFRIEHTSDVLRILVLWRFGGIYLDLDVIALKNLNISNFACFEEEKSVNNAIMKLDRNIGKNLASSFLR